MMTSRITVTLDDDIRVQISEMAEKEERSKANMIRVLLREALVARGFSVVDGDNSGGG